MAIKKILKAHLVSFPRMKVVRVINYNKGLIELVSQKVINIIRIYFSKLIAKSLLIKKVYLFSAGENRFNEDDVLPLLEVVHQEGIEIAL